MFRAILLLALVATSYSITIINPGPAYPPTKGEIWPKPQNENKTSSYFTVDVEHFDINIAGETCEILENAVSRYKHMIERLGELVSKTVQRRTARWEPSGISHNDLSVASTSPAPGNNEQGREQRTDLLTRLEVLNVRLSRPCEEYPYLDMVESYDLTVSVESVLTSASVWGILRGLESFSQLLYLPDDYSEIRVNSTTINDFPRYAHRGLLLDTSRHYISLAKILKILDAMAYNKYNVFHWHIVDDQSFPYVSARFPNLSERGAYHRRAVYTPQNVALVVKHARDRGIRVVPEFDVPGHTRSWGEGYPELLTQCFSKSGNTLLGLGPMDPIKNQTYKFLKELFEEVKTAFPDKYLHVGGDEVDQDCWHSNPEIMQYIRDHNMTSVGKLHAMFMTNLLAQLTADTSTVVWQEVVENGVKLANGSVVQIWKTSDVWGILTILASGYRVVYSTCWYLDHLEGGGDWEKYYACDPREKIALYDPQLGNEIIGGEACMWSEVVDDNNVISRIWPRASAAAEKLWSAPGVATEAVARRLEEHTCRMMRRGVPAQPPSGPGFCITF